MKEPRPGAGEGEGRVVEVRARTVDEAIARGLVRLGGLSRSEVKIEVVSEGRSGLLGFGAEEAVVRLTEVRGGPPVPPVRPASREAARREPTEGRERAPRKEAVERREPPVRKEAPAAREVTERRQTRGDATARKEAPASKETPTTREPEPRVEPAAERPVRTRRPREEAPVPAPEIAEPERPRPSRSRTATGRTARPAKAAAEADAAPEEVEARGMPVASGEDERAAVEEANGLISQWLELLGCSNVTIERSGSLLPEGMDDDRSVVLTIRGEGTDRLLADDSRALLALQFLLRMVVSRHHERWVNLLLDVDGDRARRIKELFHLAGQSAELVEREGVAVSLPPMTAYERRVVHLALRDHPTVATQSIGAGDYRKVTVRLKGQLLPEV